MFLPRRPSARVDAAVTDRPRISSHSRYASRPPSEGIFAPWNSSLSRRSKATRKGSFVSPVASAMTSPSDLCYVSDPHNRISAEDQLKAAAPGKYGLTAWGAHVQQLLNSRGSPAEVIPLRRA